MGELKETIEKIVNKVKNDDSFAEQFKENPIKAIENVTGIDLPDGSIDNIVDAVKAKINLDDSGIMGKITGLFN